MIVKVNWRDREEAYQWASDRKIHLEYAGADPEDYYKSPDSGLDLWKIKNKKQALFFAMRWGQ